MHFLSKKTRKSIPIIPVASDNFDQWLEKQDKETQNFVHASGFTGAKDSFLLMHQDQNTKVILATSGNGSLYTYASLPARLPRNDSGYYISKKMTADEATQAALGWALGCYSFDRYKSGKKKTVAALVWPDNADRKSVRTAAEATYLVRDLVNTPANDMGPEEIAVAGKKVAATSRGAKITIITGDDLLKKNYPAIHAVGKGSPRKPRLIDIRWGQKKHPLVTLIGKGVAFDTGGLDLKPSNAMALMKKDMGGAAHVLGLAQMIMAQNLPVRLRVLIPAVENSTDGNSYRPGDILQSRKGITIEVGDTDAEGRIVLCDAIAEACKDKPSLMIDFATLTGAARVALGPDLPAMFCNDDKIAEDLLNIARRAEDPLWRLPLWQPYKNMLSSKIADTNNVGGGHAGAITAALFLEKFVDKNISWIHIDTFAWTPSARPGRPEGGEALGMRACYELIKKNFSGRKK